ncbi:hypothetical protein LMG24076_03312 [Trinickia soli]|uniref:Fatty acid desaturase n=2 Tax=Trinickia soli TaxID=380675 RepID=A0A2N7VWB0_9BURK|nr:fatty acid desaturase [Trinickia soli]CAB3698787.1 hypothetical protein LMG24076_03312 [Trinickia soli]
MVANAVLADVTAIRKELVEHAVDAAAICSINPWRPVFDLIFDWCVIVFACVFGFDRGIFGCLLALFAVGNRQRALGNLLHEASHRNLHPAQAFNDWLADILLAPALFTDLNLYRVSHSRHHAKLGVPGQDPDYIIPASSERSAWRQTYWRELMCRVNWRSCLFGHLTDGRLKPHRYVWMTIWWLAVITLLTLYKGLAFSIFFVGVWVAAKATVFYAITWFREMCDHFGLERGGIFSFTRDTCVGKCWRWIIHPHNNGYHLSHHLMPSVPYYRLPVAQQVLSRLPSYAAKAIVCNAYFYGWKAVVRHSVKLSRSST